MKPFNLKLGILSLALFLLAGASDALAERIAPQSISESSWDFELYVDIWFPKAPATIFAGDLEPELPESVRTIYRSLNFASMARFNAHKGPLGLFINNIYFNGSWNDFVGDTDIPFKLNERLFLTSFGASYELGRWDIGKNGISREITLEPFAGAFYFHDNITSKVGSGEILPPVKSYIRVDTISPLIGLQSRAQLSKNWDFLFIGNYGGFHVDGMKKTYQLDGYFEYNFNWGKTKDKSARAFAGYRYLYVNHLRGDGDVGFKVVAKGPLVGIGFLF
jgi:hypothetical protein